MTIGQIFVTPFKDSLMTVHSVTPDNEASGRTVLMTQNVLGKFSTGKKTNESQEKPVC